MASKTAVGWLICLWVVTAANLWVHSFPHPQFPGMRLTETHPLPHTAAGELAPGPSCHPVSSASGTRHFIWVMAAIDLWSRLDSPRMGLQLDSDGWIGISWLSREWSWVEHSKTHGFCCWRTTLQWRDAQVCPYTFTSFHLLFFPSVLPFYRPSLGSIFPGRKK